MVDTEFGQAMWKAVNSYMHEDLSAELPDAVAAVVGVMMGRWYKAQEAGLLVALIATAATMQAIRTQQALNPDATYRQCAEDIVGALGRSMETAMAAVAGPSEAPPTRGATP